jgi:hypothetical protein
MLGRQSARERRFCNWAEAEGVLPRGVPFKTAKYLYLAERPVLAVD